MAHRMLVCWIVGAMVVAASSCGDGFAPTDAMPIALSNEYRTWWAKTEDCSGLHGDAQDLQLFTLPGADFDCPTGRCIGRWEPGGRIYIATAHVHDEMVVRHEMLHALINAPGHPDPPFSLGCGLTWDSWTASANTSDWKAGRIAVD